MVRILCTHVCIRENETVETTSGWVGGGEIKENVDGDEFKYDMFDILYQLL
jgi:hypothetical protein